MVEIIDLNLGRFGDRRLEKGSPIFWVGLFRMGRADFECVSSAAIERARSASPGFFVTHR
jgi:hypothetical protein